VRVRRLLVAVITVGLVAPTAAIVSTIGTPAAAAVATSIVPASGDRPLIYTSSRPATYGDNLYANVDIVAADGSSPYGGTTTVYQMLAGQSTWSTISTTSGAYVSLSGVKARGNATYRISWTGSGEWTGATADVVVKVSRDVDTQSFSGRQAGFKGKVSPKGKVKIVIQKKVGKKYKKFRTQKTDAKGRFTVTLPAPRRGKFFWKITFSGNKLYTKTVIKGSTYPL
jgi:hypothetical protein